MLCIGGVYAWSIYVPPLINEHSLLTAQTQLVFGLTVAVFALMMIVAGLMERRRGPRITAIIGAALYTAGYIVASFSGGSFGLLLVGIGILSGSGIAFCYVTSLATPIKWFPGYKGLITGISVAGFGGGAILLSWLTGNMLNSGVPVLQVFRIVGISYGIVLFLSALLFSVPEKNGAISDRISLSNRGLLRETTVWALFLTMFAGTFAGLLVIGNLKPIGLHYGISEIQATSAISFLAVGNMTGRVVWGFISDKLGGRRSIILALTLLTLFTLLIIPASRSDILFLFIPFLVGFGFGANFVLFAAEVVLLYGSDKLGTVYPYVFLSYGLAGILGPSFGGWLYDVSRSYTAAIFLAATICILGVTAFWYLIPARKRD